MKAMACWTSGRCAALAVAFLCWAISACGGGSRGPFASGEEPEIHFLELTIAGGPQRQTEPRDAIQAQLRIRNRADFPIDLYQVQMKLEGNVRAVTQAGSDVSFSPEGVPRPGLEKVELQVPANDVRTVTIRMRFLGAQSPTSSSGPLIPSLRGQMYFHSERGDFTRSFYEKLTGTPDVDESGEDDEYEGEGDE